MDAITDLKQAASISPYEPVRAKILRDLLSPDEQVQLHALESLRDYFGEQCVSYSTLQKCRQYLEKRGTPPHQGLQNGQTTYDSDQASLG